MTFNKKIFIFISTLICVIMLAACGNTETKKNKEPNENTNNNAAANDQNVSNINETGMPIVNEPISLKFFTKKTTGTADNWNDAYILNHYEDMTNVNITWEQTPQDSLEEKRNLVLATGDYPDAFFASDLPATDILKYGEQGTFIPLNDLIDEHAPNIKKMLDENPDIRKAMVFPDGNIYSLPAINWENHMINRIGAIPYIRTDYLDALDMEMPETLDDFYDYLVGVRDDDPSNGEVDAIPFGGPGIGGIFSWINGSFGLGNRGSNNAFIDMDPNEEGKVRFIHASDEYKELLEYVRKLYDEELIQKDIYSVTWDQFLATGAEGRLGSYHGYNPEGSFGIDVGAVTEAALPLKGPYGDRYTTVGHPVAALGQFLITNSNQHPVETIKWVDYFYSEEGTKLWYLGIEGETYDVTPEGEYAYSKKLTDDPDWTVNNTLVIKKYLVWLGMNAPGIVKPENVNKAEERNAKAYNSFQPYIIDETWPAFTYTPEENKVLTSLGNDISKYVTEMRDKFVSGDESLDNWDKYIQTLNDIGLKEYMEVQEAAVERYEDN